VEFSAALNTLFDNAIADDVFQFNALNPATAGSQQVVNLSTIEALFLNGSVNDGVTTANLSSANAVAAEFNSEFAITAGAGEATLLLINDTTGNSAAIWQYVETGATAEIQIAELSMIALITANATVNMGDLALV
jgi:succinylarginine dihydrolase